MVNDILQVMVDQNSTSTNLKKYIAPSYYTTNNLSEAPYLVDNYSPVGFTVKSYNSYNGYVTAEIWGKNKSWVHELTFKVVKENGKLYVYPGNHSSSYVKPWYIVRTNVND